MKNLSLLFLLLSALLALAQEEPEFDAEPGPPAEAVTAPARPAAGPGPAAPAAALPAADAAPRPFNAAADEAQAKRADALRLIKDLAAKGREAHVAVLPVTGELNAAWRRDFEKRFDEARKKEGLLILEIDTAGNGDLQLCRQAAELLKNWPGPRVAYIHGQCGGGALLLALNCSRLYIFENGNIGGPGPGILAGLESASLDPGEKESLRLAWRKSCLDAALEHGHDPALAEALADPRALLKGKPAEQPRVFKAKESCSPDFGNPSLCEATVKSAEELAALAGLPLARIERHEQASPPNLARSLLPFLPLIWALAFIALVIEVKTVGFGIPGSIGLCFMALSLWMQHQLGLVDGLDIGLIAAGWALVALEIFVLPGVIIPGVCGCLLVFVGMMLSFMDFSHLPPASEPALRSASLQSSISFGIRQITVTGFVTIGGSLALAWLLPKLPFYRRMVLDEKPRPHAPALVQGGLPERLLLGLHGKAVTDLRPVGTADIDGQVYDVVTRGEMLDKGELIRVVEVEGNRVVVEKRNS
ncbi:MAG: hypothetical protein RL095_2450 [Verrucomicrobiota bacterium]|jgi:membrane-bound serine protease (ClpP class)